MIFEEKKDKLASIFGAVPKRYHQSRGRGFAKSFTINILHQDSRFSKPTLKIQRHTSKIVTLCLKKDIMILFSKFHLRKINNKGKVNSVQSHTKSTNYIMVLSPFVL